MQTVFTPLMRCAAPLMRRDGLGERHERVRRKSRPLRAHCATTHLTLISVSTIGMSINSASSFRALLFQAAAWQLRCLRHAVRALQPAATHLAPANHLAPATCSMQQTTGSLHHRLGQPYL